MDTLAVIEQRRSIRAYTDQPVTDEQLQAVVEAARISPSWKNGQCCNLLVIKDSQLRRQIGEITGFNPQESAYSKAPYLLVLCADPDKSGHHDDKDYYLVDSGICLEHAVLAAQSLGLATCWIGFFPEAPIKKLLGVPEQMRIVALTPLGHAGQTRKPRVTKALDVFTSFDGWQAKLK